MPLPRLPGHRYEPERRLPRRGNRDNPVPPPRAARSNRRDCFRFGEHGTEPTPDYGETNHARNNRRDRNIVRAFFRDLSVTKRLQRLLLEDETESSVSPGGRIYLDSTPIYE